MPNDQRKTKDTNAEALAGAPLVPQGTLPACRERYSDSPERWCEGCVHIGTSGHFETSQPPTLPEGIERLIAEAVQKLDRTPLRGDMLNTVSVVARAAYADGAAKERARHAAVDWRAYAHSLRLDASGECGRMSATRMYELADLLDALAAPTGGPEVSGKLRECICADPWNCTEEVPGYVCRKGNFKASPPSPDALIQRLRDEAGWQNALLLVFRAPRREVRARDDTAALLTEAADALQSAQEALRAAETAQARLREALEAIRDLPEVQSDEASMLASRAL